MKLESGQWYFCHVVVCEGAEITERVLLRKGRKWYLTPGNSYSNEWTVKPLYKMVKEEKQND